MSDKIRQCLEQTGSLQVLAVMLLGQPSGRAGGAGEQSWKTRLEKNTAACAGLHHPALCMAWQGVPLKLFLLIQNRHWRFALAASCNGRTSGAWKIAVSAVENTGRGFWTRPLASSENWNYHIFVITCRFQKFCRMRHLELRRAFLHAQPLQQLFWYQLIAKTNTQVHFILFPAIIATSNREF